MDVNVLSQKHVGKKKTHTPGYSFFHLFIQKIFTEHGFSILMRSDFWPEAVLGARDVM